MRNKAIVFIVLCMVGISAPAFSMDFILGAKAGYFAWRPFIADLGGEDYENVPIGTGFLGGPVLSFIFTPDISFSVTGLFGTQSAQWHDENEYIVEKNTFQSGTTYMNVWRYDIDSAISYRLNEYFKIFAGWKFQYLVMNFQNTERRGLNPALGEAVDSDQTIEAPQTGPAIGVGLTVPLSEHFFFMTNISMVYMWGDIDFDFDKIEYKTVDGNFGTGAYSNHSFSASMRQYGVNVEPAFGIRMADGGFIVTVGGRFQYLNTRMYDPSDGDDDGLDEDWHDYLFGGFVSVMYAF